MKRLLVFSVVLVVILFNYCERHLTGTNEPPVGDYVFENSNCLRDSSVLKKYGQCYLRNWNYNNDMLELTIYYWANCCPDLVDSVAMADHQIDLFVCDLRPGCYCICDYNGTFYIDYTTTGDTRIRFHFKENASSTYTALVDTVIAVK